MKLYAERGRARTFQLAGDAVVVAWCLVWVSAGVWVYRLIEKLAAPGEGLVGASQSIADRTGSLPGILRPVESAFDGLGDALRSAGEAQTGAVHDLALVAAIFVAAWPVIPVLGGYLIRRVLWMRAASAVVSLRHLDNFEELMARRAVVGQPLHRLAGVSKDPIGDLETGNYGRLAALEAARYGLTARR